MFRLRLKKSGAFLALASLLVLNLHVLAHVFGQDHDDDGKGGKAAPCALCQAVLAQHTLAAAPSIEAPSAPGRVVLLPPEEAPPPENFSVPSLDARGPPGLFPV